MFRRLTQDELEASCAEMGLQKLLSDSEAAEKEGRASGAFYAKELLDRFVARVAVLAENDLKSGNSNRAHVSLVQHFDPRLIAFIACSCCLNAVMAGIDEGISVSVLRSQIGRALYNEHFLRAFESHNKELFSTLTLDLHRRRSQNARHYATVMKMQAKKAAVPFYEWSATNIAQVGDWCVDLLVRVGMIETEVVRVSSKKTKKVANVSDEVLDCVIERKQVVSYFRPRRTPFVEPPLDWPGLVGGGYHTRRMQNTHARCIKASPTQLERVRAADISVVTETINALQKVGWCVNQRVLSVLKDLYRPYTGKPKPEPLAIHQRDKETWTEGEKEMHKAWKRVRSEWYTEQKLGKYKSARTASTIMMAEEFGQYPVIYFMYFADWRCRYYPVTSCLSPQGPDEQKALLQFSEGMGLPDANAVKWFFLHGTSKYGFDKTDVQERLDWVAQNHDLILAVAQDPVGTRHLWQADEVSKPWQFLAWCFEYSDYIRLGKDFVSYLPVSMDGTCNGLQNYSAMGRDPIGAAATNLLPSEKPNDIYQQVANVVSRLIVNDPSPYARLWLEHGINRKVVKRCVMTLPYGAKKFSFTRFIQFDYLAVYRPDNMSPDEWKEAASFLGEYVWKAIRMVVVAAIKLMEYFIRACRAITAQKGVEEVWWMAPNGCPIVQAYYKVEYVQCRSRVTGTTKLNVMMESDRIDKIAHADGISPNIIHSCDASHLSFTVLAAAREGIRHFAMIHDDYGTHAANAETLARLIREEFAKMYSQNVFEQLADCLESQIADEEVRAKIHASRPELGDLDVTKVVDSTFFFI